MVVTKGEQERGREEGGERVGGREGVIVHIVMYIIIRLNTSCVCTHAHACMSV